MTENPYEPPKDVLATDTSSSPFGEIVYYRTDSRRLTYAEFWRISRNSLEFVFAAVFKTLRIRLPTTFAFSSAISATPIDPQQMPETAIRQLRPLADQAEACGLRYVCAYVLPSLGAVESSVLAYGSDSGSTVVLIVYARAWSAAGVNEQVANSFLSRLADGRVVATCGTIRQLNAPPEYSVEYWPGLTLSQVFERHRARLIEHTSSVVGVHGPAAVFAALQEYERRSTEFQHARGVYVVASPHEMETLSRLSQLPIPTQPVKSRAFQGLEFLCLVALVICLYFGSRLAQVTGGPFVVVAIGAACTLGGLSLIWIYRAVQNRRNRQTPR